MKTNPPSEMGADFYPIFYPNRIVFEGVKQGFKVFSIKCERNKKNPRAIEALGFPVLVGAGGFEPPKSSTTDLQSAPFGHSGTLPYLLFLLKEVGAGRRTRTPDLLITNQLLYQLSYTSTISGEMYVTRNIPICQP